MIELPAFLLILLIVYIMFGMKILKEHERVVVFHMGIATKVLGPGIIFVLPIFQACKKIDISQKQMEFLVSELGENRRGKCLVSYSYRIVDPFSAATKVLNPDEATMVHIEKAVKSQFKKNHQKDSKNKASAIARNLIGEINRSTGTWGAKIYSIEIKDLQLPE